MADGKKTVLIVDDNQEILDILNKILTAGGYGVKSAQSAEAGLKVYQENKPDAMIVDLMMEEVDAGANFVKELKLLGNQAPVFLLSAAGDKMAENTDYHALGFSGVFQKPVDQAALLNTLKAKLA